ncbi:MAG: CRTAC1 family protein [Acidobacteriota bacterium]
MRSIATQISIATLLISWLVFGSAAHGQVPQQEAAAEGSPEGTAAKATAGQEGAVLFRDIADPAGVVFEQDSAPEKKYILESMAGGVALFDFDGDGRLDIYLVNSLTVETADQPQTAPSALYRNLGPGQDGVPRFEDVAREAGVAFPGWGMGACVADFDGDGWRDLYVTGVDGNRLYSNDGDGTFTDVTRKAGVVGGGWSAGCAFADYDRDGILDLFVSRYVETNLDDLPVFGRGKTCTFRGIAVQCGPRGLPGTSDLLYRGTGDGRFTEVSQKAGVADPDGYFGLGVAWLDYNEDGWPDLFVANDSNPNFFYENQKDGTFEEMAFPLGVAVSEDGGEQGCMGVAVGDYENKGRFDLFVTNFSEEYNALYQNQKDYFIDVSFRSASAPASLPYVGWSTAFFDYDHDGWQDLIVVNGHVYPQLANANLGASASYQQRKLLYRNLGVGTGGRVSFEEVAGQFGEVLTEPRVSRGLAIGDLDDDGRLDMVINDLDGKAQVLRHEMPGTGNWLKVQLRGKGKMTDAIGAILTLKVGKLTQKRLIRSGTGYLSQDDMRQHFGLGAATRADSLEVLWPDGSVSTVEKIEANQQLVIRQE